MSGSKIGTFFSLAEQTGPSVEEQAMEGDSRICFSQEILSSPLPQDIMESKPLYRFAFGLSFAESMKLTYCRCKA